MISPIHIKMTLLSSQDMSSFLEHIGLPPNYSSTQWLSKDYHSSLFYLFFSLIFLLPCSYQIYFPSPFFFLSLSSFVYSPAFPGSLYSCSSPTHRTYCTVSPPGSLYCIPVPLPLIFFTPSAQILYIFLLILSLLSSFSIPSPSFLSI